MTRLYLNDTVLQKRNAFFVINSTAEIRQDTLSYTLTTHLGLEDAAAEMTRMEEVESARREQQKLSSGGESKEKLDRKMFRVV